MSCLNLVLKMCVINLIKSTIIKATKDTEKYKNTAVCTTFLVPIPIATTTRKPYIATGILNANNSDLNENVLLFLGIISPYQGSLNNPN